MTETLKILSWNANGLGKHITELEIYLIKNKIDLCLISESHNTTESVNKIRGYKCYNAIHPLNKPRGGVAIFIKDNIKHYEKLKIESEEMQVITITLYMKSGCASNISAIYCPPRYNITEEKYIHLFKLIGPNFVLGGDFNAKNVFWGSRLTTT